MKKFTPALLAAFLCAGFSHGTQQGVHQLNVGGGGQMTDIAISGDGVSKLIKNDSGTGYISVGNGKWRQLNTRSNFASVPVNNVNNLLAIYSAIPAPNNHNRIYQWWGAAIFRSDDTALTSPISAFIDDLATHQTNGAAFAEGSGPHIAVDPVNPDIAIACSPGNGAFKTTNGGVSWSLMTGLPSAMPLLTAALGNIGNTPTTKTTTAGSAPTSTTLSVNNVTSVTIGNYVYNVTNPLTIPQGAMVTAASGTTITIDQAVLDGGVGGVQSGDTIRVSTLGNTTGATTSATTSGNVLHFSFNPPGTIAYGVRVYDRTNPSAIPPNTFLLSYDTTSVTLSNNVAGTVGSGDSIGFNQSVGGAEWEGCVVAYDPTTSINGVTNTVYAMPSDRGIWKSTDGGGSWAQITSTTTTVSNGPVNYSPRMVFGSDGTMWLASASFDYGGISTLGTITGGSGYTNGTYNNVPLTGGTGNSATANITVSGGAVTAVTLVNPGRCTSSGSGCYLTTNTLSAATANIGGTGSGFSVPITGLSSNLWKYASGTWTQLSQTKLQNGSDPVEGLAVDPANPLHVVINGLMNETLDGAATNFSGKRFGAGFAPKNAGNRVATDVPWLAQTNQAILNVIAIAFDPGQSNLLYVTDGIGMWKGNPPGCSCAFDWTSQNTGIENLTDSKVLSNTSFPYVITTSWDRPIFVTYAGYSFTNTYPSVQQPSTQSNLVAGWDADWASSDPMTICDVSLFGSLNNFDNKPRSGCSPDGGQNWGRFGFFSDPNDPRVVVSVQSTIPSNQLTVSSIPAWLQVGATAFTNHFFGPFTTTSGTATGVNPAVLHFGPGVLPAALNTNSGANTTINVQNGTGLGNFIFGFNTLASINTGTGDATMINSLANIAINAGDSVYFTAGLSVVASNSKITNIDRVNNVITLDHNLLANAPVGLGVTFTYAPGDIGGGGGSIAATTPCNIIVLPRTNAPWPWYTKDCGVSWNPVIVADASGLCTGGGPNSCPGFNADGSAIGPTTGWGGAYSSNTKQVIADRVSPNTFYMMNCRTSAAGGGLYRSTDNGDHWTREWVNTGNVATCGQAMKMQSTPGVAGDIWFIPGESTNSSIYHTTNGGANMAAVAGVGAVKGFTLGAAPAGGTYPTLYIYGTIGSTLAIYRSKNAGSGSPTFPDNLGSTFGEDFGVGLGNCFEGDANVYGRVYGCAGSGGWKWGYFPYLLKRDLDPAANDNSPAFMNMVG